MNLQGSIHATPEGLAKVILSTPPRKVKIWKNQLVYTEIQRMPYNLELGYF